MINFCWVILNCKYFYVKPILSYGIKTADYFLDSYESVKIGNLLVMYVLCRFKTGNIGNDQTWKEWKKHVQVAWENNGI